MTKAPNIKVIAIDFDGCLCSNNYPNIGDPNWKVISEALEERSKGSKLILWTCRTDEDLDKAICACKEWGLEFDAINDNISEWKDFWNNNTRKVGASEYWDDKAVYKGVDNMSNVDHPSHYQKTDRPECIVEMAEKFGYYKTSVFCLLNAFKYLYRAGEKEGNSEEQDLQKAEWYINWVNDRLSLISIELMNKDTSSLEFNAMRYLVTTYFEERKR